MTDDYLWDKSGPPDPEVQRLEEVLGVLGTRKPLNMPPQPDRKRLWLWLSAGVFAAAAAGLIFALWLPQRSRWPECFAVPVEGAPTIGSKNMDGRARLRVGEWLETDTRSRAKVSIGRVATVDVEPNTSLQLVQVRPSEDRISLKRGKMHATVFGPPRLFFVDTPSAVAIDLGCAYTVEVDGDGNTRLEVNHGMVSVVLDGRESFIPEGAVCVARRSVGPGVPYYSDAAPSFISALDEYERNPSDKALQVVLSEARPRDALTLWHLIGRTSAADRVTLVNKLTDLVPPPAGVSTAEAIEGDAETLWAWFEVICPQARHHH